MGIFVFGLCCVIICLNVHICDKLSPVTTSYRSTLPQHFDTKDGHYLQRFWSVGPQGKTCSSKQMKQPNSSVIQNYNIATEMGFAKFCQSSETTGLENALGKTEETENIDKIQSQSSCSLHHDHEHMCTMNQTSMEYRTVYKMLVDNNSSSKRVQRFEQDPIKTGKILRWNIADIFDVPLWHSTNIDCSHFCYIPP